MSNLGEERKLFLKTVQESKLELIIQNKIMQKRGIYSLLYFKTWRTNSHYLAENESAKKILRAYKSYLFRKPIAKKIAKKSVKIRIQALIENLDSHATKMLNKYLLFKLFLENPLKEKAAIIIQRRCKKFLKRRSYEGAEKIFEKYNLKYIAYLRMYFNIFKKKIWNSTKVIESKMYSQNANESSKKDMANNNIHPPLNHKVSRFDAKLEISPKISPKKSSSHLNSKT